MNPWYRVGLMLVVLSPSAQAQAQKRPPEVLVDDGVCPSECFEYGRWTAISCG